MSIVLPCSLTGFQPVRRAQAGGLGHAAARGFTLIELLLVLALLSVVIAVESPTLARFFRGRNLDAEAQRFLALTRYGQNRAVAEGVPMVLWMDAESGQYGLEAEATYAEEDPRALPFEVSPDVELEVDESYATARPQLPASTTELAGNLPAIRFTPDGFISEDSPQFVTFRETREGSTGQLWVGWSRNRLNYEIKTNQPAIWQRLE
jgi:type II secretion system protein H